MPTKDTHHNVSSRGVNLVKSFEGFRAHAYKPVPGEKYWTIGYGDYGAHVKSTDKITEKEATRRLLHRLEREFVPAVNKAVTTYVNQNRFDAMVSLCYNIGVGGFSSSSVVRYTNKRQFRRASASFMMWVRGSGHTLPGLVRRRRAERKLFMTPVK